MTDMQSPATANLVTLDATAIADAAKNILPYLKQTLIDFVACQSLSGQEEPAAIFMEAALEDLGLASERIHLNSDALREYPLFSTPCCPDSGRYNLLARHVPRTVGGKSILFNGHLDVVPTGPAAMWTRPPFEGYEKDGWMYGRGAGDMKGGIVCALAAFKAFQMIGLQPAGVVGFNGVLEEECTGNGTLATVSALKNAIAAAKLTSFDAVVIPEPVFETLMEAEVGVFWLYVDIFGKPAHAGYMTSGKNPIEAAHEVLADLKKLEAVLNEPENRPAAYKESAHPINFNLGQLHAGEWNSSVPCTATMGLRIGLYPAVSADDAIKTVEDTIKATMSRLGSGLEFRTRQEGFSTPGCFYDLEVPAMQTLAEAHRKVTGQLPGRMAHPAVTDGRYFRLMTDMPVTCYGPIARDIHGIDESVSIESLLTVTTTLMQYMHDWCGLEKSA